tara:strand:+ start:208 stop:759 length:552 start_codon:yes stop_codon:yes gene_type:complete
MKRRLRFGKRHVAVLALLILPLLGCGAGAGSGVEFKPAAVEARETDSVTAGPLVGEAEPVSSRLGFVQKGEATAMENGGRVALGEDKIAEIFLAPYPPDWNTDLNLFLLEKETFQPVTDVDVDLEYEMVYMDHGIDAQVGTKVADGHYVLPVAFLMYGDWSVDVTVQLPEGRKHLRFIVKFLP